MELTFRFFVMASMLLLGYANIIYFVNNYYSSRRLFLFNKTIIKEKNNLPIMIMFYLFVIITMIFSFYYVSNILLVEYLIYCFLSLKQIKFKFTRRSVLLCIVTALEIVSLFIISFFNLHLFLLISLLYGVIAPFFVSLANLFLFPFEEQIRNHYIKKAQNKIKENKKLKVIGITGSYGKTSTKLFLKDLLANHQVLYSSGNINTLMGLTKFINDKLNNSYEILIVEIGVDHINSMYKFSKLLSLDVGILTSIGPQHLATFKTIDNVKKEKLKIKQLIKPFGCFFYSSSCNIKDKEGLMYSLSDYLISENEITINKVKVKIKLTKDYQLLNAIGALKVAKYLYPAEDFSEKFKLLEPAMHRGNTIFYHQLKIIDESYNINAESLIEQIKLLKGENAVLITRGLVETGKQEESLNLMVSPYLNAFPTIAIIDKPVSKYFLKYYEGKVLYYKTLKECLDDLLSRPYKVALLTAIPDSSALK